jgi:hypothetical protein
MGAHGEDETDWDEALEDGEQDQASGTAARVSCPYCGEDVEIFLDPESRGEMVHDCEVCCRPWQLEVSWTRDGRPIVRVEPI